jgi:1-acyl-sn-glycerol-3-phosphate acyltransferase
MLFGAGNISFYYIRSLLYYLAKIIMGPALACYFRRSWYLGKDLIPAQGAVVVISNHAASFLDAMLMGVMLDRPIHFYVRGDIYKKKWVRFVLGQLHMIPLYSADLSKNQMHKNASSFSKGEEVLRNGGLLLIFPEGLSRLERNMIPLKKGVSRIILQTLAADPVISVKVVPIGIHYSRHEILSDVQLTTGLPLDISDSYRALYADQPARAVNDLTQELEKGLREVMLYVAQDERSDMIETQLELFEHERSEKFSYSHFTEQKQLCARISALSQEQAIALDLKQNAYKDLLKENAVDDIVICKEKDILWTAILLLLSLPLFLISFINYPPYFFGKWVADTKVKRQDFYTSVITAVSALSYIIWLAIQLAVALLFDNSWLLALFVISPLLGWFASRWWSYFTNWKFRINYRRTEPDVISALKNLRKEIRNF